MASRAASKSTVKAGCTGSPVFNPEERVQDAAARDEAVGHLVKNDLQRAITSWFQLPVADKYVYHAMTSIQLAQVQAVVNLAGANNLHAWYRDEKNEPLPPPPQADIDAYVNIFQPSTNTVAALKAFAANAKKSSIRLSAATALSGRRFIHPSALEQLTIPKSKKPLPNPYFDFWAWSCRNLEWCGPCPESERAVQAHHVLPIFMHHFGCAVPSHEALSVLKVLAGDRSVVDVGSGNGYWTFMLRQYGFSAVYPVDNAQSEWRTNWVSDTTIADGVQWLSRKENAKGQGMVLLLVYPIVGGGIAGGSEGGFTRGLVAAYEGDTIAVVGTQNHNGYTGFKGMTMAEFMEREHGKEWVKVVQIPLPSFAGKDEALFVFQRGDRAPKEA